MSEQAFPVPDQSAQGGPYSADDLAEFVKMMTFGLYKPTGIYRGPLNGFEVSESSGKVRVDSGIAMVNGRLYFNDTAVELSIPNTPSVGTTGGRAVLRLAWDEPTAGKDDIYAALLMSDDGDSDIPDYTQDVGTVFEIPLASFTVTTGGAVTITTDDRAGGQWFHPRTPQTRWLAPFRLAAYAEIATNGSTLSDAVNVVSSSKTATTGTYRELTVTFSTAIDFVRGNVAGYFEMQTPDPEDNPKVKVIRYYAASDQVVQLFGFKVSTR